MCDRCCTEMLLELKLNPDLSHSKDGAWDHHLPHLQKQEFEEKISVFIFTSLEIYSVSDRRGRKV